MIPTLAMVGGFLGSGKTTLILSAATKLRKAGRRVGVILNDQAGELVDTRLARTEGMATEEVTGGCFCCRFSEFIEAAGRLLRTKPEVVFAEPVGSCADVASTVLSPIRRMFGGRFRIAPFTVLVDPGRARQLLAPDADPDLSYLFRQQLAEADLLLQTKSDLHPAPPHWRVDAIPVSAITGLGVGAWLEAILSDSPFAAASLLDIDYGRYAEAEAALGWLNWRATLRCLKPLTPAAVAGPFLHRLDQLLTSDQVEIVHLKLFVQAPTGHLKASICQNGEQPSIQGPLDAAPACSQELILNLRAKADPIQLTTALDAAAKALPGRLRLRSTNCFSPARPRPEYRFTEK